MRRFRVSAAKLAASGPARSALLQSIVFEDHGSFAIATVAREPVFELVSLGDVLAAMKLARTDVEEVGE